MNKMDIIDIMDEKDILVVGYWLLVDEVEYCNEIMCVLSHSHI